MDRHVPVIGEIYEHFKGKYYRVVDIVKQKLTGMDIVICQTLQDVSESYAIPLDIFLSKVDETEQTYRFKYLNINIKNF